MLNTHTPELPIRSADPVVDAKTTRIGAAVRVRGDIMETSSHAAADEERAAEGIKHQPEPPLDPSKHGDRTVAECRRKEVPGRRPLFVLDRPLRVRPT